MQPSKCKTAIVGATNGNWIDDNSMVEYIESLPMVFSFEKYIAPQFAIMLKDGLTSDWDLCQEINQLVRDKWEEIYYSSL